MGIEVYFENHKAEIDRRLMSAKTSLKIAVAWINFKTYFNVFEFLRNNGVELEIICSDNRANRSHQTEIEKLEDIGVKIKLLKMPSVSNYMHHKFALIDGATIINGSFNWSPNAMKSFENIMVVSGEPKIVTQFDAEFEKLRNLESGPIKCLQKKVKCKDPNCDGFLYNVLVFSKTPTKYNEAWGDVVEVCSVCDHENHIQEGVQDNSFHFLFDSYEHIDSYDDETKEGLFDMIDRDVNSFMATYINNETIVHAIGIVGLESASSDGDSIDVTRILWKNKFVGDDLPDLFWTNFGVVYE
jgi:hypothetical protein